MEQKDKHILWQLTLTFLKIGAFTFGGGYAMIAMIERDIVDRRKWLTNAEFVDLIAIAETTPGVIALNSATFVGAKIKGFWGALLSSIAVLLPAFFIILIISLFFDKISGNPYVKWAFLGVRSSVVALIFNALFRLGKKSERSLFAFSIMIVAFVFALLSSFGILKIDVVFVLVGIGAFGVLYGYIVDKKKKRVIEGEETFGKLKEAQEIFSNDLEGEACTREVETDTASVEEVDK